MTFPGLRTDPVICWDSKTHLTASENIPSESLSELSVQGKMILPCASAADIYQPALTSVPYAYCFLLEAQFQFHFIC